MKVNFHGDGDRTRAEVGDGIIGPAGLVAFTFDGIGLEFDRAGGQLAGIAVDLEDGGADEGSARAWPGLVPGLARLRAAGGSVDNVDFTLPSGGALSAAYRAARLDSELLSGEPHELGSLVRVPALLELIPLLARVQEEIPQVAGGPQGLRALGIRAQTEFLALAPDDRDALTTPLELRSALFGVLVERAAVACGALAQWAADLAPFVGLSGADAEEDLLRGAASRDGGSVISFRGTVQAPGVPIGPDGRFETTTDITSSPVRGQLTVEGDHCLVSLDGFERTGEPALGPPWVRAYAGKTMVAGGPVRFNPVTSSYAETLPLAGAAPESIEVGLNPYRFGGRTQEQLTRRLVTEALRAGRRALQPLSVDDADRWRVAANAWLAAGFLDRAALACGYAGNEEKRVWVRSDAARARLEELEPPWRADALAWLHR